jgi:hypothetical protein
MIACDLNVRPPRGDAPRPPVTPETELHFYSRRAQEESRAATRAACPQAAAAHRYLAAAYAGMVKRELETAAELDDLARLIP